MAEGKKNLGIALALLTQMDQIKEQYEDQMEQIVVQKMATIESLAKDMGEEKLADIFSRFDPKYPAETHKEMLAHDMDWEIEQEPPEPEALELDENGKAIVNVDASKVQIHVTRKVLSV